MPRFVGILLALAVAGVICVPHAAYAQVGNIAGTVRDGSGGVLPGVTVDVTSPQLIGGARSTVTDENGRYQIASLPAGVYRVTFKLDGFSTLERRNVQVSSEFTAPVNGEMQVGNVSEVVEVVGTSAALVDVRNVGQRQVFTGEEIVDLPTTRNLGDLIQLVPGIAIASAGGGSEPNICGGGQADANFGGFGGFGGCSPILQGFNAHSSMNDASSLNQGRMQVDGLGIQSFGGGGRSSYVADIGNAQEVTFSLSGALGESETGGATINVIPRTGGNRFAGNYFTAYSNDRFFDTNDKNRPSTFSNRLEYEYDVNGAFGGPLLRDRLWFYGAARRQDRENWLQGNYRNLNAGVFGANYQYDPDGRVNQSDTYQNASMRLTVQATRRDKLNLFWDEQYTCENPCRGGDIGTSIEATDSNLSRPLNVAQASWTNPLTGRLLLEAGASRYKSHRNETRHILEPTYPNNPRITETGSSVAVVPGALLTTMNSGSINNAIDWKIENWQSRASVSYITGSHNFKVGYQGQYMSRLSNPYFNNLRLQYNYATPAANCSPTKPAFGAVPVAGTAWCGLFPDGRRAYDGRPESEPLGAPLASTLRPPVPASVVEYIPAGSDERGWFAALYVQDQWTWNRFTLNGALRYDDSRSRFGKTCRGPDVHTRFQYCLNDTENGDPVRGVTYKDITPRWGVAWDVFGSGKTSVKWSMGKYLQGSSLQGIYVASNPASGGRTINSLTRTWRDLDGDRIVDCDLSVPEVSPATGYPANGECAALTGGAGANARRFGRSPTDLDELGLAIGLNSIYCGVDEPSMSDLIRNYCDNYFASGGSSTLEGWGKRQYEWQQSIGVQHEVLPGLSAEVTYNRRQVYNHLISDDLGEGCDLYSTSSGGGRGPAEQCMQDLLNFKSDYYDFFGIQAPVTDDLPRGGGYVVQGIATPKVGVTVPAGAVEAFTITRDRIDFWSGVDTNFIWRAPHGLRITGGTSTGRRIDDQCAIMVDNPPNVVLREGVRASCYFNRPFQTNVRGTATYTVPWVDVLVSSTFSVRPGVERSANYTVDIPDVVWGPNSQGRIGTTELENGNATAQTNLLDQVHYGESITLFDLKLAKNIRFAGKRLNIGLDVYNVTNSDAALGYCNTYPNPERGTFGCGNDTDGWVDWGAVNRITAPRYARFQVRFDF